MKLSIGELEKRLLAASERLGYETRRASEHLDGWAYEHRAFHTLTVDALRVGAMYRATLSNGSRDGDDPAVIGEDVPPSWLGYIAREAACVRARTSEHVSGRPGYVVDGFALAFEELYGDSEQQFHAIADRVDALEERYAERYEIATAALLDRMGMQRWDCQPAKWEPFTFDEERCVGGLGV